MDCNPAFPVTNSHCVLVAYMISFRNGRLPSSITGRSVRQPMRGQGGVSASAGGERGCGETDWKGGLPMQALLSLACRHT